jgi:excisionase family DNA binding protein
MNSQPARTPESPVPPRRSLCGGDVNRLLNAQEVADCLGVTAQFVYTEARADRIPYIKLGRYIKFHPDDIDDWLRTARRGRVA